MRQSQQPRNSNYGKSKPNNEYGKARGVIGLTGGSTGGSTGSSAPKKTAEEKRFGFEVSGLVKSGR